MLDNSGGRNSRRFRNIIRTDQYKDYTAETAEPFAKYCHSVSQVFLPKPRPFQRADSRAGAFFCVKLV